MTHRESTEPDESTGDGTSIDLVYRRILVIFAAIALGAGVFGVLGMRGAEATASGGGYDLTVHHAAVSRPGLATPFDVTVTHAEGLPEEITLEVSADYLAAFDENGLDPQPATSFSDGEKERWVFHVPEGEERLTVSFDARIEPSVQWARTATVTVLVDGREVTSLHLRTWVMP